MPLRLRRLDLNSDRIEVISALRRLLHPEFDDRRFDWLYLDSPFGVAKGWVACEAEKGVIVGCAAAFPRKVCIDGKESLVLVLGVFWLDSEYSWLRAALRLQRAFLEDDRQL